MNEKEQVNEGYVIIESVTVVNGQNPKRRRYQSEVMNDEQTRCKPPDLR